MATRDQESTRSPEIVLVNCANGLVGMAVREQVAAEKLDMRTQWFFASSKDADLRDLASTQALFGRVKPTHVLHLAAHVGEFFPT